MYAHAIPLSGETQTALKNDRFILERHTLTYSYNKFLCSRFFLPVLSLLQTPTAHLCSSFALARALSCSLTLSLHHPNHHHRNIMIKSSSFSRELCFTSSLSREFSSRASSLSRTLSRELSLALSLSRSLAPSSNHHHQIIMIKTQSYTTIVTNTSASNISTGSQNRAKYCPHSGIITLDFHHTNTNVQFSTESATFD